MLNSLKQLVWDTKDHQYEIALNKKLNYCILRGVQMCWIGYKFFSDEAKNSSTQKEGDAGPLYIEMFKYAFLVLLHLLSCLLYKSQNIYERKFHISHEHLYGPAFIPLLFVLLCHLALFFSGTFIFFFYSLSKTAFAPLNCVQPTLLIALPPHISISEALKLL